jgi:hypothetical protein
LGLPVVPLEWRRTYQDSPSIRIDVVLGAQPVLVAAVAHDDVLQGRDLGLETLDPGGVHGVADDDLAVGALEHRSVRLRGVTGVKRDPDRAGDGAAEEHVGGTDVVVLEPGDAVAGLHTERALASRTPRSHASAKVRLRSGVMTAVREPLIAAAWRI